MAEIPKEAMDAVTRVLRDALGDDAEVWAEFALKAAEAAWPHETPKRDPASSITAVTTIDSRPPGREYGVNKPQFGFGPMRVKA